MSPPVEQLIRDYLNRLSVAARGRLTAEDRRDLVARTHDLIDRSVGSSRLAAPTEVAALLARLGDPELLVEQEETRLAVERGEAVPAASTGSGRRPARLRRRGGQASWHWPRQEGSLELQKRLVNGAAVPAARGTESQQPWVPPQPDGPEDLTAAGEADAAALAGGTAAPALAGEADAPALAGGTAAPELAGEADAAALAGGTAAPELAGEADVPALAGGTAAPELAGEADAAALAGRQEAPGGPADALAGGEQPGPGGPADALAGGEQLGPGGPQKAAGGPEPPAEPGGPEHPGPEAPAAPGEAASSEPAVAPPASAGEPDDSAGRPWWPWVVARGPAEAAPGAPSGADPAESSPRADAMGEVRDDWPRRQVGQSAVAQAAVKLIAATWRQARLHPVEAFAVVLLGLGGAIYPPVWILGAGVALASRLWDYRDKWIGLAGPVLLLVIGTALGVSMGHSQATFVAYVHEGWIYADVISRIAAVLGTSYLLWRVVHGRRAPAVPPWNRPHRIG
jgi:hypothetical protein